MLFQTRGRSQCCLNSKYILIATSLPTSVFSISKILYISSVHLINISKKCTSLASIKYLDTQKKIKMGCMMRGKRCLDTCSTSKQRMCKRSRV